MDAPNAPNAPRTLPRPLALAALAVALAFGAHLALTPLAEMDLFFHLKIGQLIVEQHRIPFQNLFSFTYPAHADPDLSWAFQVLVALLHRAGAFAAIAFFKPAAVAAALALQMRAARRAGAGSLATAATAVAVALAAEPRMVERPHLVTFVGLGVLANLLAGDDERRLWRRVLVLTVVWANFHAGVFLAPLTLALWALGARLDGKPAAPAARAALAALAGMFATPAGPRLPAYLLWHTGL